VPPLVLPPVELPPEVDALPPGDELGAGSPPALSLQPDTKGTSKTAPNKPIHGCNRIMTP
jgi:hypothetical protein